mmetsp:Transcript_60908/g.180347  ORF Transcript_60908/g.180347 Transcript_60908/m.180347 type:complete len:104 (+) Transcript_60908:916-1227(+)
MHPSSPLFEGGDSKTMPASFSVQSFASKVIAGSKYPTALCQRNPRSLASTSQDLPFRRKHFIDDRNRSPLYPIPFLITTAGGRSSKLIFLVNVALEMVLPLDD